MKKRLLTVLGVTALASPAEPGDRLCGRPVRTYCYLPCYQYAHRPTSNPRSETTTGVLTRSLNEDILKILADGTVSVQAKTTSVKVFQLSTPDVTADHCQLSNIVMAIMDDGTWIASCRALQNPNLVDSTLRPRLFNYKRNGFHVGFRGVGQASALDPPESRVLGQPEYFEVSPAAFWINAGEQRSMRWTGRSEEVRRYFTLAERVDVELRYE